MSALDLLSGISAGSLGALRGFDALKNLTTDPNAEVLEPSAVEARNAFAPSLARIDARGLIDSTRDLATNLFKAFRTELKNALDHVGISGGAAAALIGDISLSFANAVREGADFSMSLVAAAYQETIIQAGNTVSHALEFSASALQIDYNHATGEFSADTSTIEIDAVKITRGDGVQMPNALFDFTDVEGPGTMAEIFDSVQQYLVENGFADNNDAGANDAIDAEPDLNEAVLDSGVMPSDEQPAEEYSAPPAFADEAARPEDFGTPAFNVRAVEQFTNAQQQEVTRLTIDLFVSFKFAQAPERPANEQTDFRQNRGIGLSV
ncbi:MAG: hypothetical protein ACPGRZ_11405 [Alphaproteobacteria bacterium]